MDDLSSHPGGDAANDLRPLPTDYFVILDRDEPARWLLVSRVDHLPWRSAVDRPTAEIPADLDEVGRPEPTEEGRVVLWATTALDRQIVLHPLPGSGHVYRVMGVEQ